MLFALPKRISSAREDPADTGGVIPPDMLRKVATWATVGWLAVTPLCLAVSRVASIWTGGSHRTDEWGGMHDPFMEVAWGVGVYTTPFLIILWAVVAVLYCAEHSQGKGEAVWISLCLAAAVVLALPFSFFLGYLTVAMGEQVFSGLMAFPSAF